MCNQKNIRNITILAHVDFGKSTLCDAMLRQSGTFHKNEEVTDRVLDSNDLERERGITILAKNASVYWKGVKVNLVDNPGHVEFSGEVDRTLMMADGALLLVDAAEGCLPQTRSVLKKCLERNFPIIVVINKIDRKDARPDEVLNEIFDLFCDLNATDAQADFTTIYAVGREGIAKYNLDDSNNNLIPLFDTILSKINPPQGDPNAPLQMIVCNLDQDNYVGRIAIGRIVNGTIKVGQRVSIIGKNGIKIGVIKVLYTFEGLNKKAVEEASAGENIALAGIEEIDIGDTISSVENPVALPRIVVEEPTLKMRIGVNTSPTAGKCASSKYLTSRHLKERLDREIKKNLAIKMAQTEHPDTFELLGRGELQLAILFETMRREGYEFVVGNPEVVTKQIEGKLMEPLELAFIDIPDEFIGIVTEKLAGRKGTMTNMGNSSGGRVRLEFKIPSRGLIGFRNEFLTLTRGTGLLNTTLEGWVPVESIVKRTNGAMVAISSGKATIYAVDHLQSRGFFFIDPGVDVYEGMIVGEHNRPNDADVSMMKEKKLTNCRSKNKDENVVLAPPKKLTIDTAIEWIDVDELVEVTPDAIRLRKRVLSCSARPNRRIDAIKEGVL